VFFIATANTIDTIPRPLLDRMEIIRLSGTEEEADDRHLIPLPRQRTNAGLSERQLIVPDDVLLAIIQRFTREAGVRELERMIGRVARKVAAQVASGRTETAEVGREALPDLLGPERFFQEQVRTSLPPGVATGLAWTEAGGDVLYVETVQVPDTGAGLSLTGQLGKVMKESARAALSYVLSHASALGIEPKKSAVHIHVPAGAIPKDGPSAGVTMATLASLLTGLPVLDTAMTGEITPWACAGGASRKTCRVAGIRRVICPANEKICPDYPRSGKT
jgi:ATP-dependent Lon protease